ncbi:pilus assembly protein TadG-related protein [Arthrobacter castelli]|uniref:pilus assembly protein TadG-related protein n=1 Tax=Arthrobacter castelli TaxID=271431 RepID=UPI00040A0EF4|nr:pilus assembly protein TadG-related protein [Arthrobacter castelli]
MKLPDALKRMIRQAGARWRNDDGQVMVLIIGYVLLSLLVVTVVMAVSAVYIEHKRLLSVADSAAVAAADTFSLGQVERSGSAPVTVLSDGAVADAVASYLNRTAASGQFHSLRVDPATGTTDNRTAHVVLSAVVHPPVVNIFVPEGIPISVVSDARSQLQQ